MLLNAIQILPAHLLSGTADLKLPKSVNVGGAIARSRLEDDSRIDDSLEEKPDELRSLRSTSLP